MALHCSAYVWLKQKTNEQSSWAKKGPASGQQDPDWPLIGYMNLKLV